MAQTQKQWKPSELVSTTDDTKRWTPENRAEETNLIMNGQFRRMTEGEADAKSKADAKAKAAEADANKK